MSRSNYCADRASLSRRLRSWPRRRRCRTHSTPSCAPRYRSSPNPLEWRCQPGLRSRTSQATWWLLPSSLGWAAFPIPPPFHPWCSFRIARSSRPPFRSCGWRYRRTSVPGTRRTRSTGRWRRSSRCRASCWPRRFREIRALATRHWSAGHARTSLQVRRPCLQIVSGQVSHHVDTCWWASRLNWYRLRMQQWWVLETPDYWPLVRIESWCSWNSFRGNKKDCDSCQCRVHYPANRWIWKNAWHSKYYRIHSR